MWISKKEWDSLMSRIEHLERRVSEKASRYEASLTVWAEDESEVFYLSQSTGAITQKEISAVEAIRLICTHLGLDLKLVPGQPTRVALVKQRGRKSPS